MSVSWDDKLLNYLVARINNFKLPKSRSNNLFDILPFRLKLNDFIVLWAHTWKNPQISKSLNCQYKAINWKKEQKLPKYCLFIKGIKIILVPAHQEVLNPNQFSTNRVFFYLRNYNLFTRKLFFFNKKSFKYI